LRCKLDGGTRSILAKMFNAPWNINTITTLYDFTSVGLHGDRL